MQYEINCSLLKMPETSDDAAVRQVMEAVSALERVLKTYDMAATVRVRDVRGGRNVHEAVMAGSLLREHPLIRA